MNTTIYITDCNAGYEPQSYILFIDDVYVGVVYADDITFCAVWRNDYE